MLHRISLDFVAIRAIATYAETPVKFISKMFSCNARKHLMTSNDIWWTVATSGAPMHRIYHPRERDWTTARKCVEYLTHCPAYRHHIRLSNISWHQRLFTFSHWNKITSAKFDRSVHAHSYFAQHKNIGITIIIFSSLLFLTLTFSFIKSSFSRLKVALSIKH